MSTPKNTTTSRRMQLHRHNTSSSSSLCVIEEESFVRRGKRIVRFDEDAAETEVRRNMSEDGPHLLFRESILYRTEEMARREYQIQEDEEEEDSEHPTVKEEDTSHYPAAEQYRLFFRGSTSIPSLASSSFSSIDTTSDQSWEGDGSKMTTAVPSYKFEGDVGGTLPSAINDQSQSEAPEAAGNANRGEASREVVKASASKLANAPRGPKVKRNKLVGKIASSYIGALLDKSCIGVLLHKQLTQIHHEHQE